MGGEHPVSLDTATLLTNVCIAIGTIGAAGTALWLGLSARSAENRAASEARSAEVGQVIAVFTQSGTADGSWVEIVNACSSIITNVRLIVTHDGPRGALQWRWSDENEAGFRAYVQSGEVQRLAGAFWGELTGGIPVPSSLLDDAGLSAVELQMTWQDIHGRWWSRHGMQEPFATTGAKPWQSLEVVIPRQSWIRARLTANGRRIARARVRAGLD